MEYFVLLLLAVSTSGVPGAVSEVSRTPSTLEECQAAGKQQVEELKARKDLELQSATYLCVKFPLKVGGQST